MVAATNISQQPLQANQEQQQQQQQQQQQTQTQTPENPDPPTTASTSSGNSIVGTTCMELALEGERLCKLGDFKNGVKFFEEAIRVGTQDDRTLSAIYSQLGNAYFYLEDYNKALEYHKRDVTLVHSIGDEIAEAKACGNLGNTFKMLAKFEEAAIYCRRHLEISRKLQDSIGEGRALYNLGNVYHTQGKRMIGSSEQQEPGELSSDIRSSLLKAIEYYEQNLAVVSQANDYAAMGRAYGNLGNTHYLLGNFESAVEAHQNRLELAKKTQDKSAERRAHLNLGNANVFLGYFKQAIENYSSTLRLAQELQDKYTEAHSCYSLANTYTFLRDYESAIAYHLKYLDLIKDLDDKLGEGRASWSLVNIYQMVNKPESALVYAKKHYEIADMLGDKAGLASAKLNIEELEETISQKQAAQAAVGANSQHHHHHHQQEHQSQLQAEKSPAKSAVFRLSPDKRQEQEQRRFKKQLNSNLTTDIDGVASRRIRQRVDRGPAHSSENERLFDMIAHFQSGRIDDQRCEITHLNNLATSAKTQLIGENDKENDSQQFNATNGNQTTGGRNSQSSINPLSAAASTAASVIKATYRKASLAAYPTQAQAATLASIQSQRRPTVSAEHREQLFDLIAGAQNQRMDEQRASLPAISMIANGVLKNPTSANLLARGHTLDHQNQQSQAGFSSSPSSSSGPSSSNQPNPSSSALSSSSQANNDSNSKLSYKSGRLPETIPEHFSHNREKSHSIVPQSSDKNYMLSSQQQPQLTNSSKPKLNKLTKHFQTLDSEYSASVGGSNSGVGAPGKMQDKGFLDSLMKYQSTRFNDQRSEFPRRERAASLAKEVDKGQAEDFFNLVVRFQSDRIDDQRSAPPPAKNKNL